MHKLRLTCLLVGFLTCFGSMVRAQQNININNSTLSANTKNVNVKKASTGSPFEKARRYREFSYNPRLKSVSSQQNVGDTLLLDFFEDKEYKAVVKRVSQDVNGVIGITTQIVGTDFAYCYLAISSTGISIEADIPMRDEQFFVGSLNGKEFYLSEYKMSVLATEKAPESELDADVLRKLSGNYEGHDNMVQRSQKTTPEAIVNDQCPDLGLDDPAVIDVLMLYTPAARDYANLYMSEVNSISEAVNIIMQKANLISENSNLGITFNLVGAIELSYYEQNTSADVFNIQRNLTVRNLRDEYNADLVPILMRITFAGGMGPQLLEPEGDQNDFYSINSIRESVTGYTVSHEMGHNLGTGHHSEQNTSAGGGLYSYSTGWRGQDNTGRQICTIMTYEPGSYYSDNTNHTRIPYYSSPDIVYNGVRLGNQSQNNAFTLKQTKHLVAAYRNAPLIITIPNFEKNEGEDDPPFTYEVSGGASIASTDNVVLSRVNGEIPGEYSIMARIYRSGVDVTCQYLTLQVNVGSLTINASLLPAPTITINGSVFDYDGTFKAPTITIDPAGIPYTLSYSGILANGTSYPATFQAPTAAGTYTLSVNTEETATHLAISRTATFTVNSIIPIISLSSKTTEYTGSPVVIGTPVITGGTAVADLIFKTEYEGINSTVYARSETAPVNAGEHKVYVGTVGDNNHMPASVATNLTIRKATSVITGTDQTLESTGLPVSIIMSVVPANATVNITYKGTGSTVYPESTVAPSVQGTYLATVTVPETNNYTAVSKTFSLTLREADPIPDGGGVTIGSGIPPAPGASLQLKESDNLGANSKKGLLLPRVNITDINSLNDIALGLDPNVHIGLIVYNVYESTGKGLYVWNGTKWERVSLP